MLIIENKEIPLKLEIDVILTTLFHAFMSGLTDANLKDGEFDKKWDPNYVKSLINRSTLQCIALLSERVMTEVFLEISWADRVEDFKEHLNVFNQEYESKQLWDVLKGLEDGKMWEDFIDNTFKSKSIQMQLSGNYKMKSRQDYDFYPAIDAAHGITKAVSAAFIGYAGAIEVSNKEKVIDENSFAAILTWTLIDLLNKGEIPESIIKKGRPTDYRQYFLELCGGEAELSVLEDTIAITFLNNIENFSYHLKSADDYFKGSVSHYFADVINRFKAKQAHEK